ncbi:hypothetical protein EVAR_83353_1 [Eumeta japonica]|uniref:Uncharacterized protein n=1 Tax=Eumeta variegata TaxID=151549 RepID=A0A4C1VY32_EUMVA|nr:hypothetical protein EVAR_83353_1 [Eumeta japonica]
MDDAGRPAEFSELDGQVCEHTMGCSAMFARGSTACIRAEVCYRPSKRGTEDGVRDDGGWAGDTWYRREAPKAGGPRSVRVCRSLKGKGQRRARCKSPR